jgi:hypothetical protein
MKKGLVIGGSVVGAIIVIAVAVFAFVLSNLDGLVKEAVEKVGGEATRSKVALDKVEISLKSGSGRLAGLTVGNPAGFKTPSAFELGAIKVTLDTASVGGDTIVIKEIAIDGPKVTYELAGANSNIDAIKKNVDAYKKQFEGKDGQSKKAGEGPKLIINNLYIRGGQINVSAGFLQGKALGTPLPDIHLKDIGKKEKGASPGEVATQVIDSMTKGVGSAVGALNLDKMMGNIAKGAGDAAKAVTEGAGGAAKSVSEGAAGVGKALEQGAGEAGSQLKKLFGK